MIRIDEIYNNTFWPWFDQNLPGYRMYMCDPFGRSDPESVKNYGHDDAHEHNYIFFFDQEPIHLNIHNATFDEIRFVRNPDLHNNFENIGAICTSEKNSDNVDIICKKYNWRQYYYFFHGWAALDWYRGYNKTFLIQPWSERFINKTFIAPNRIVAGERQHRLEVLYYIFKNRMTNNHISCPAVCPAENISVLNAVKPLIKKYPDIESVFAAQPLPINFEGESDHPMHSCWLSLFDQSAESLLYLVTETVATGRRLHLTEKTFKPIALGMPFVIVGTKGSLEYLRSYGFQTFSSLWDESYDQLDDETRIQKIAQLLEKLDSKTQQEKQQLFEAARPIIEHNWNHFYNGGFEQVLWQELTGMLNDIKSHS
jgi:hypothetical protein